MYHETVPAPSSKCKPNMANLSCRNWHNHQNLIWI